MFSGIYKELALEYLAELNVALDSALLQHYTFKSENGREDIALSLKVSHLRMKIRQVEYRIQSGEVE